MADLRVIIPAALAALLCGPLAGCAPLLWQPAEMLELTNGGTDEKPPIARANDGAPAEEASPDLSPARASQAAPTERPTPQDSLAKLIREVDIVATSADGDQTATAIPLPSPPEDWTVGQLVDLAIQNHPAVQVARRNIEVARGELAAAGANDNPNFVFDVETPLHDDRDRTEISTRITFPIGRSRERQLRCRAAQASLMKAEAEFRQVTQRVASDALSAAIRVLYLQQRFRLDTRAEQLAHDRVEVLAETQFDRDPASEFFRSAQANLEAGEATRERFATERALAVARAELAVATGMLDEAEQRVGGQWDHLDLTLPRLETVLASAESASADVAVALAAFEESWRLHQLSKTLRHGGEIGPLYQDRLGRNDDQIGMRIQTDVPLARNRSGRIAAAAGQARHDQDQLLATRHEVLGAVTKAYRELEILAAEIQHHRRDDTEGSETRLLNDPASKAWVAGPRKLELELAVLDARRERLELKYRFVLLDAQLDLATSGTQSLTW